MFHNTGAINPRNKELTQPKTRCFAHLAGKLPHFIKLLPYDLLAGVNSAYLLILYMACLNIFSAIFLALLFILHLILVELAKI